MVTRNIRSSMKLIRQKHKQGCASACLAMIANLSYEDALTLIHPSRKPKTRVTTNLIRLSEVLKDLNLKFRVNLDFPLNPAIVVIKGSTDQHAVIWDGNKILDPARKIAKPLQYYQNSYLLGLEIIRSS